jgi:hypothetical protein
MLVQYVYGVDAKVIVWPGAGPRELDASEAVPHEEHLAGLDVHLLEDTVQHRAVHVTAHRT